MICFLWIVAAIKLIVPIQIESPLGLLPDYTPVLVSTSAEKMLARIQQIQRKWLTRWEKGRRYTHRKRTGILFCLIWI